jgi:hypothetical protein
MNPFMLHIFFKKGFLFVVLVQSKTVEISVTWYLERKYALATFSIVQPHSELLSACTCSIY